VLNPNQSDVAASALDSIRYVQVTLIARADQGDPRFVNNYTYRNQQGSTILGATGDRFRRRILSTEVRCRNMGL